MAENKRTNIMITGGLGFIGSHLARCLLARTDHTLTILDDLIPQVHGHSPSLPGWALDKRVNFVKSDICDKQALLDALRQTDVLVHLAADTGTGQSMYQVSRYMRVNTMGTAILCDLLINETHTVRKIVLSSSRAVYGEGKYLSPDGLPVFPQQRRMEHSNGFDPVHPQTGEMNLIPVATDVHSQTNPVSVYGTSKLVQEQLLQQATAHLGLDLAIFRIQNAYGEGQSLHNPYTGIIPLFTRLALGNNPILVFEDGQESRDFIHVTDVVDAIYSYLASDVKGQHVLNLGTAKATTLFELAEIIKYHCQSSSPVQITGTMRKGDIRHNFADISCLFSLLGFKPGISLEKGLAAYVKWHKKQNETGEHINGAHAISELKKRKMLI